MHAWTPKGQTRVTLFLLADMLQLQSAKMCEALGFFRGG